MANPTVTQFTTPVPSRNSPQNFSERANTLVSELPQFVDDANALGDWMNTTAGEVDAAATEVENNRAAAEIAATSAGEDAAEVAADKLVVEADAEQVATDRAAIEGFADAAVAAHIDADYATANGNVGGYSNGDIVLVLADENHDNAKTYYEVASSALSFIGLANALNTAAYPHLAQNKPQSYWIEKLLAETAVSVQAAPSLVIDPENDIYKVEGENKTFAEVVSYTRASDATKKHASGKVGTVATDVAQFEYGEDGQRYLLLEPSRTNLLTKSAEFEHADWAKSGLSATADTVVAPDGTLSGDTLETLSNGSRYLVQSNTLTVNDYVLSGYFKEGTTNAVVLMGLNDTSGDFYSRKFDLSAGEVGELIGASLDCEGQIEDAGNGWYRCSLIFPATAELYLTRIYPAIAGGSGAGTTTGDNIHAWCAQLEQGSYPTSYIPTTTAAVTRAAPDGKNLDALNWYNPNEGTFVVGFLRKLETDGLTYGRDGTLILRMGRSGENDFNHQFTLGKTLGKLNVSYRDLDFSGDDFPSLLFADGFTDLEWHTVALTYKAGFGFTKAIDGGSYEEFEADISPVSYDFLNFIAPYGGNPGFEGKKSFIKYFPRKFTQAQLEALTSGAA